ncbi:MAG: hypothetical protein OEZ36_07515, partial [Spirochaetota bacterium]|nr:hypothetical protein [Spirochaetota bacterium]
SDKYKNQIHPNAKDGWYKSTGSKYVLAIQGGYTFADFFELTARVGLQWLEGFNENMLGLPLFMNIGTTYHF